VQLQAHIAKTDIGKTSLDHFKGCQLSETKGLFTTGNRFGDDVCDGLGFPRTRRALITRLRPALMSRWPESGAVGIHNLICTLGHHI
jgi:hypothetical protein